MPRGSWLGFVVCVVAGSPVLGQVPSRTPSTYSQSPPRIGSVVPQPAPHATRPVPPAPPPSTPAPPIVDATVKDLTPPEFADLVPPPDPHGAHHTSGHLAPTVPGHAGFYGSAEYLLFRPRFASSDYVIVNAGGGLATVGQAQTSNYDLGNGLRAELGYRFEGGWDASFAYTYLQANGNDAVTAAPGQVLLTTLTRPGLTDNVTSATAAASLNFSLYDMTAGKRFTLDDNFAVRGFAGLRFADVKQQFDTTYDGLDARMAAVNNLSRFRGFGPIVGGEAILSGPRGFHGYARASGGLLTGRSTNSVFETNDAGATVYVNSQYNVRKIVPVASVAVGGGWQYRTVSVRAGYEIAQLFGVTEPMRFIDDVGQGKLSTRPSNLSLEGFFVQFGLTF